MSSASGKQRAPRSGPKSGSGQASSSSSSRPPARRRRNVRRVPQPQRPKHSNPHLLPGVGGHVEQMNAATGLFDARLSQLARQIMLPEKCSDLLLQPNSIPGNVCARHFTRVYDIAGATYPSGFRIVVSPDLFMPSYHSASSDVLTPAAGPGKVSMRCASLKFDALGTMQPSQVFSIVAEDEEVLSQAVPITDNAAVTFSGFNLTPVPAAAITLTLKDITAKKATSHLMTVHTKVAGGAWTGLLNITSEEGQESSRNITIPLNTDAIAFVCSPTSTPQAFNLTISWVNAQISSAALVSLNPSFPTQIVDHEIDKGRVTSMALLVTNTSSEMYNGGNINIGRVPADFNPWTNVVQNLARLPTNRRHQGRLSQGGYAWWMPTQDDEFGIDSLGKMRQAYREAEYLFCQADGWTVNSSVRITIHWCVEFYTPSQLFEKRSTPILDDDYRMMRSVLLAVPAATCNPEHEKTFKDYVKQAGQFGSDAVEWIASHKEALLVALELLGELG